MAVQIAKQSPMAAQLPRLPSTLLSSISTGNWARVGLQFLRVLLTAAILISVGNSRLLAETRSAKDVNFSLKAGEKIYGLRLAAIYRDTAIYVAQVTAGKVPDGNTRIYGVRGTRAELLVEVGLLPTTISTQGAAATRFVSVNSMPNAVVITINAPDKTESQIWVTNGRASGTKHLEINAYIGIPRNGWQFDNWFLSGWESDSSDLIRTERGETSLGNKLFYDRDFPDMGQSTLLALDIGTGEVEELVTSLHLPEIRKLLNNDYVLIAAEDPAGRYSLLRSNGRLTGTSKLVDGVSASPHDWYQTGVGINPSDGADGTIFHVFRDAPFISDGTTSGTSILDVASLATNCERNSLLQLGDRLLFVRCNSSGGTDLFALNLATNQQELIREMGTAKFELGQTVLLSASAKIGGRAVLALNRADGFAELWSSDGTASQTFNLPLNKNYTTFLSGNVIDGNFYISTRSLRGLGHFFYSEEVVVSDASVNGTYSIAWPNLFRNISSVAADFNDYLFGYALSNDEIATGLDLGANGAITIDTKPSASLIVHNPQVSLLPSAITLAVSGILRARIANFGASVSELAQTKDFYFINYSYFSDTNFKSVAEYGLVAVNQDFCLGVAKKTPGLCGCQVEEVPFHDEFSTDTSSNKNFTQASICYLPEAPVVVNTASLPEPRVSRPTFKYGYTSITVSLPGDLIKLISSSLETAVATRSPSALADGSRATPSLRIVRLQNKRASPVTVKLQEGGRFLVRTRGRLRKQDKIIFEYGLSVYDLSSDRLLLKLDSLNQGKLKFSTLYVSGRAP